MKPSQNSLYDKLWHYDTGCDMMTTYQFGRHLWTVPGVWPETLTQLTQLQHSVLTATVARLLVCVLGPRPGPAPRAVTTYNQPLQSRITQPCKKRKRSNSLKRKEKKRKNTEMYECICMWIINTHIQLQYDEFYVIHPCQSPVQTLSQLSHKW